MPLQVHREPEAKANALATADPPYSFDFGCAALHARSSSCWVRSLASNLSNCV
jgi:hypothetical protein